MRHPLIPTLVLLLISLAGCASLPTEIERTPSHAFARPEETKLGRLTAGHWRENPGTSGFIIQDTGRQALLHRAALIEAAERSIDAQYYIWNSDTSGRYLARRLLLAADRGVRVRLLLDDVNIAGRDATLAVLESHPHIEIRIYNPFPGRRETVKWFGLLREFERLNRRMHNKSFVVDGTFGIVGGRNIGDEYFDMSPRRNFRDRDVLATGEIIARISENFDAYWNSPWAYPVGKLSGKGLHDSETASSLQRMREVASEPDHLSIVPPIGSTAAMEIVARWLPDLVWARADLVYDNPLSADIAESDSPKPVARQLGNLVRGAQKEVLVESAYFILGDSQLEVLESVTQRGVNVRVLTNSLASNDLLTNHAGYARRRRAILQRGAVLHELRPDAASCGDLTGSARLCGEGEGLGLHSKSVAIDRAVLFVGSFNVNLRSAYLNLETALIIHSSALAEQVARTIETNMEERNSWRVTLEPDGRLAWVEAGEKRLWHEPETGAWRRFKSWLFSRMPIEKYL